MVEQYGSPEERPSVFRAAVVLGVGLGGLFDGIVVHQILQWHHMASNLYPATTVENLELNTLFDGLFHAGTYVIVVAGVLLLWRAGRHAPAHLSLHPLLGGLLAGWGLFNLVEGLINHQLLGLHHVKPGPNQLAWDLGFLAWGAAMLIVGWWLGRRGQAGAAAEAPRRAAAA